MNQPSRAEKFVLPDGVRKLTFTRDTKVANAGTYIVQKEDHTLGNIVRMQLHRDPNVVFAGYQVPHPSDNRIVIKVRRRSRPRAPRPRPVEPAPSLRKAPHASELRVSFFSPVALLVPESNARASRARPRRCTRTKSHPRSRR